MLNCYSESNNPALILNHINTNNQIPIARAAQKINWLGHYKGKK